jgi:hypothetical protein
LPINIRPLVAFYGSSGYLPSATRLKPLNQNGVFFSFIAGSACAPQYGIMNAKQIAPMTFLRKLDRTKGGSLVHFVLGIALEIMVMAIPAACLGVVVYDISLNGMHSMFAIGGIVVAGSYATIKAVMFCFNKYDAFIERRIEASKRRRGIY